MSSTALQHRLNRLRQRIIALGVSAGAGWGAVLAAVVVLVALWLDLVLELSPAMRLGGEALALLGGLVLFVGVMATAWRDARPTSMARQLDRAGQTGGQILSGVELLRANDSDTPDSLTAGLAQMAVQQAGRLSQSISGAAAAPARTVLWPLHRNRHHRGRRRDCRRAIASPCQHAVGPLRRSLRRPSTLFSTHIHRRAGRYEGDLWLGLGHPRRR